MFDVVFCKEKERNEEFEEQGKELGFSKIYFIEPFKDVKPLKPAADAVLISAENVQQLHNYIMKARDKWPVIAVACSTDEINRAAVESKHVNLLLSPEATRQKDFPDWRNSGLNHVLCRLAAENRIAIGINFSDIIKIYGNDLQQKIKLAERLGRIMQNIRLCRKFKTKMLLASFASSPEEMKSASDMRSFAQAIGMTPGQAKESLESAKEFFEN